MTMINTKCPVCRYSGLFKILPYGGYHYVGRDMPLVRCPKCRLTFIVHGLKEKEVDALYHKEQYFDSEYAGGATKSYEENKEEQLEKACFALNHITNYIYEGSLLEIGCAQGYFLRYAKDVYGFDPKGIEPSQTMSDFGKNNLELNIHCGSIFDAPKEWDKFDLVYIGDVLEHVPDPNRFVSAINSRMNMGGYIAIEIPLTYNITLSGIFIGLINILRGRFGKEYWLPSQHRQNFVHKPPYHIIMFGRKSIGYFLTQNGFKIVFMKTYESKPKEKSGTGGLYVTIKKISHFISTKIHQKLFGDKMIVIAMKVRVWRDFG